MGIPGGSTNGIFLDFATKSSRPRPGAGPVLVPGEPDRLEAERRTREGIPLNSRTVDALRALSATLGVSALELSG
jgi:LDH2 family malate/lactate/ureidoglycolate dehydrogenase